MSESSTTELEHYKLTFDYLKHLTTLSTGSIILLVSFLEKIFAQPRWKPLVAVSLSGFTLSVLGALIQHTQMLYWSFPSYRANDHPRPEPVIIGIIGIFVTWLSFLLGVTCLTVFAIKNLFQ